MAKTDKEIEAEAKLAVNGVIRTHKKMAVEKLRPEIRKAFPFGPTASAREKRIWEDTVKLALDEMSRWPQTLPIILLVALTLTTQPAVCDSFKKDGKQWYVVTDDGSMHMSVAPNEVPLKTRATHGAKVAGKWLWLGFKTLGQKASRSNIIFIFN